jgi:hypothetical protein
MHESSVYVLVNLPRLVETVASDGVIERYSFKNFGKYDCTISYDLWKGTGISSLTTPCAVIASAKSDGEMRLRDTHQKLHAR